MEHNTWPSWLKELWPNWLENIEYPAPGVGDLADLKLSLGVGENGKWVGFITPGWFYHDNKEQYHFVQRGSTIVTDAGPSSGEVIETISFRPSWGPVLVSGENDVPYREHHNSLYPGVSLSWADQGSGIYSATIPSDSILVGLRDLTSLPLGAVSGTGLILSPKLYHLDGDTVYIKPKDVGNIEVWADLVYTSPKLRFRELVIQEEEGVLPSYQYINNIDIIRGTETENVSGFHTTGYISHSLTASNGDWVVLEYDISRSFILSDHKTLEYFTGGATGIIENIEINYETSIPDILPSISLTEGVTGTFNVNPLYERSYRAGYLFHSNPASSWNDYWTPGKIELFLDKDSVCKSWNELLKVTFYVADENKLPLPDYPVTVTVTGGSAIIKLPENRTDGRGEIHYIIKPDIAASTISVTGTVGSLSVSASASAIASGDVISLAEWHDGHINLVTSTERTKRGAFRLFTNCTDLDGIPRTAQEISIFSRLASEFHKDSNTTTASIIVPAERSSKNIFAISELGYVPQPNDSIVAFSGTHGQSVITRSSV
jgi:hypothetical protein